MTSNPSFCLFLGDLSLFCTEKDILSAFSPYGRVTNVRIKRSNENKKHLLYGFVEYASASEAVQAMQAMNGSVFLGRALRVRWASSKQGKKVKADDSSQPHGPSVFVVFLVYQPQRVVNESVLRSVFEAFGPVDDVVVKQSKIDPVTGQQKGYAFVQYTPDWAGVDAATTAVANLDNFIIDGVGYKCEVSYNTEELRRQLLSSNSPPVPSTHITPPAPLMIPQSMPQSMAQSMQQPMQQAIPYAKPPSPVNSMLPPPIMAMNHSPLANVGYKMDNQLSWAAPNYPPSLYPSSVPMPMNVPYFYDNGAPQQVYPREKYALYAGGFRG